MRFSQKPKKTTKQIFMTVLTGLWMTAFLFACNKKEISPPREISPQEALGMLKNDFGVLVDVERATPPENTGSRTWILFTTGVSSKAALDEKVKQWATHGQKLLLLGGRPEEWDALQLPLKEGRLPNP